MALCKTKKGREKKTGTRKTQRRDKQKGEKKREEKKKRGRETTVSGPSTIEQKKGEQQMASGARARRWAHLDRQNVVVGRNCLIFVLVYLDRPEFVLVIINFSPQKYNLKWSCFGYTAFGVHRVDEDRMGFRNDENIWLENDETLTDYLWIILEDFHDLSDD